MKIKNVLSVAIAVSMFFSCKNAEEKQVEQDEALSQEQVMEQFGMQIPQLNPEDVTDEQLEKLASALMKMQMFNQDVQMKMMASVEEQGMELDRFSELYQEMHSPNAVSTASDEEKKTFETINESLMGIQMEAQQKMEGIIVEEGLTVELYEGIAMLIQQDTTMQAKFQSVMERMAP